MPLPKLKDSNENTEKNKMPSLDKKETPLSSIEEDDGVFTKIEEDEVILRDELDNYEESQNTENKELPQNDSEYINDPFESGTDISIDTEDEYIDKEKIKIKPFGAGRKKNKKIKNKKSKIRAKDFDERKNSLTLVKVARTGIMVITVGLFAVGIKNTFFPSHLYSKEDIESISLQAIGKTGFPLDEGRALAEQFTEAYFSFDTSDDNSSKILKTFYGEGTQSTSGNGSIIKTGENKQSILVQPKSYYEVAVSDNVAVYHISTLITNRKGETYGENGNLEAKWVGLAVTVYKDTDTNQMIIAKDSPQLIPSYSVASNSELPSGSKLGTGTANSDLYKPMSATIIGFLKAYGNSTIDSHSEIDQYVKTDADSDLYNGFGGQFKIDESEITSSNVAIYPVSDDDSNSEWKVDLSLKWHDSTGTGNNDELVYTGRYVMTVQKSSDGKYFVTAFRPYVYTPNDSSSS